MSDMSYVPDTDEESQTAPSPQRTNDPDLLQDVRGAIYDLIQDARTEGWDLTFNAAEVFSQEMHTSNNQLRRMHIISEIRARNLAFDETEALEIDAMYTEIFRTNNESDQLQRLLDLGAAEGGEEGEGDPSQSHKDTQTYPENYDLILSESERIEFNVSIRETMQRILREGVQSYDSQRDAQLWREYGN